MILPHLCERMRDRGFTSLRAQGGVKAIGCDPNLTRNWSVVALQDLRKNDKGFKREGPKLDTFENHPKISHGKLSVNCVMM